MRKYISAATSVCRTCNGNILSKNHPLNLFGEKAIKGLITWLVSVRAEISHRPPGLNIVSITCSSSARAQNANLLRCENTVDAHARVPFPARAEKMIAITRNFFFQPVCPGCNLLHVIATFILRGFFFRTRLYSFSLFSEWSRKWITCFEGDKYWRAN